MGLVVRASAPARAGIVGNPSDIYGGKVLSCSVPVRASCAIAVTNHDQLPDDLTLWSAAVSRLPLDRPVKVEWSTEIPRSSGLAGSTALLTATVACLLRLRGEDRNPFELAELVRDIERNGAGVVCGYQDAYMASLGGLELMDFAGKHPTVSGPLASVTSLRADLPFLLITTGVKRLSGSVHGPIVDRWLAGEGLVVDSMDRLADLATLGAEALVGGNDEALAMAMNENQAIISRLGGSGEAIDRLIGDCLDGGALAAKLAGAGMGGTVIALTRHPEALQASLAELGYAKFLRPSLVEGLRYED